MAAILDAIFDFAILQPYNNYLNGINGFLDPINIPMDTNSIALCQVVYEIWPKIGNGYGLYGCHGNHAAVTFSHRNIKKLPPRWCSREAKEHIGI